METKKCKECGRELPITEFMMTRWGHCSEVCNECVQAERAFKAGASWRINSVWHTMYEMPKQGLTLCVNDNGCALICGPNYDEFKNAARELGFTRWAYVSDLLPEGKEDRNG